MTSKKLITSLSGFLILIFVGVFYQNCAPQNSDEEQANTELNSTSTTGTDSSCRIAVANGNTDFSPSLVGTICLGPQDKNIVESNGWYVCKCPLAPPPTPPPPSGAQDPGYGLWVPAGTTGRIVADPSGPPGYVVSYVPGCLNGGIANNSATGCAANSSFQSTLTGTKTFYSVSMGSGKQLAIRYRPNVNAGSTLKALKLRSSTGAYVNVNARIWLSPDPTATYDSVSIDCRQTSSLIPMIITGPGYCPISETNQFYYFIIDYAEPTALRFQVDQNSSDFH